MIPKVPLVRVSSLSPATYVPLPLVTTATPWSFSILTPEHAPMTVSFLGPLPMTYEPGRSARTRAGRLLKRRYGKLACELGGRKAEAAFDTLRPRRSRACHPTQGPFEDIQARTRSRRRGIED